MTMRWNLPLSEFRNRSRRQSENCPLIERFRAQALVELDRGGVPIQNNPLEPLALSLDGHLRHSREKLLADAIASPLGPNVKIFQVDARAADERREVLKVNRVSNHLAVDQRDQGLSRRPLAEQ